MPPTHPTSTLPENPPPKSPRSIRWGIRWGRPALARPNATKNTSRATPTLRLSACGVVVAFALAGCAAPAAPRPDARPASPQEAIDGYVSLASGGIDVLIETDGTTQTFSAGIASDAQDALDPGRSFRVGSISKTFVATMIMQMVEEGSLDLASPLSMYLPDTRVGADTTIRQLLSHQSGLANYTDTSAFFADILFDPQTWVTPDAVLDYVVDTPPSDTNEFSYSNTNYILLGQLIESIDATDLNAALDTRIAERASLDNTYFEMPDNTPDDLVGGWSYGLNSGDPRPPLARVPSSAWAAGALISTTNDLADFLDALVDGKLVSPASFDAMSEVQPAGYGLGLAPVDVATAQPGIGHGGATVGYSSLMTIDPDTGDTLIVLSNNDALPTYEIAESIRAAQ